MCIWITVVIRKLACNWTIWSLQKGREKACTPESLKGDWVLEKTGLRINQVLSLPTKEKKSKSIKPKSSGGHKKLEKHPKILSTIRLNFLVKGNAIVFSTLQESWKQAVFSRFFFWKILSLDFENSERALLLTEEYKDTWGGGSGTEAGKDFVSIECDKSSSVLVLLKKQRSA